MALNVFISYATKDLRRIEPLLEIIKSQGQLSIFQAERSIKPGEEFRNRILKEIANSDVFLLFYSNNAEDSIYVQHEIGAANSKGITIIPILLDETKPKGMIVGNNYVDLSDPDKYEAEKERLLTFIKEKIRKNELRNAAVVIGLLLLFISTMES